MSTHAHAHTHVRTHTRTYIHMYTCTYIHTCTNTHTHARAHTHTHTHMHVQQLCELFFTHLPSPPPLQVDGGAVEHPTGAPHSRCQRLQPPCGRGGEGRRVCTGPHCTDTARLPTHCPHGPQRWGREGGGVTHVMIAAM